MTQEESIAQVNAIVAGLAAIAKQSGKAKEEIVRQEIEKSQDVYKTLVYLLDPMKVYHIQKTSLDKELLCNDERFENLFEMLDYLDGKKAANNADIVKVKNTIKSICDNKQAVETVEGILCKTLTVGLTAKTLNKITGRNDIVIMECMLANKYFDHQSLLNGREFYLTEKLDGIRCIAVNQKGKPPRLFSRQGQVISGLVDVEAELARLSEKFGGDFVLDGELLISDRDEYPSAEQYKRTAKIVRSDGEKHGVSYNVFDIMPYSHFARRIGKDSYNVRRRALDRIIPKDGVVHTVPVLYRGTKVDDMMKILEEQRAAHHEGLMINFAEAPYEFKRTNSLLKVKVMQDCDLKIVGFQEGTGKFAGTLGALVVDYKGNMVGVGSGISDADRKNMWENKEKYCGRIATIQYFEETHDADGKLSIRFPVFKDIREVGKDVSYA